MDTKLIKNLITLFQASDLASIETSEEVDGKKFSIKLEKNSAKQVEVVSYAQPVGQPVAQPLAQTMPLAPVEEVAIKSNDSLDFSNLSAIVSPMVGVFYSSSSPAAESFVKTGSRVKKGDTLCIIEAMKLMNEIVAEQDGEIIEVCVKNGDLVEFGQALFRIR